MVAFPRASHAVAFAAQVQADFMAADYPDW